MKIKPIARMTGAQDGAIWGNLLFRFGSAGQARVYALDELKENMWMPEIASFHLDKADILAPHSNAVAFGTEYAAPEDELPLLYTNIYNNYASCEDRLEGMCCVYRLKRQGDIYASELVQLIQIGFTKEKALWCSDSIPGDVRPYGNFVIDREENKLYAFTMRDGDLKTRYFSFSLPKLDEGSVDPKFGVRKVMLTERNVETFFDCEYHRFLQGACVHKGKIYSVEGFTGSKENQPALRIIDPKMQRQIQHVRFEEYGQNVEPEMIDFREDTCYYSDAEGNLFLLEFDE